MSQPACHFSGGIPPGTVMRRTVYEKDSDQAIKPHCRFDACAFRGSRAFILREQRSGRRHHRSPGDHELRRYHRGRGDRARQQDSPGRPRLRRRDDSYHEPQRRRSQRRVPLGGDRRRPNQGLGLQTQQGGRKAAQHSRRRQTHRLQRRVADNRRARRLAEERRPSLRHHLQQHLLDGQQDLRGHSPQPQGMRLYRSLGALLVEGLQRRDLGGPGTVSRHRSDIAVDVQVHVRHLLQQQYVRGEEPALALRGGRQRRLDARLSDRTA